MTKSELKELIKECLNEVVDPKYTEYSSTPDLTIVSTVTGSDVDDLRFYILELHRILVQSYGKDVQFEEKLNMSVLPNKDKKIETTFTITDIIDDLMLKTVKENIQDIYKRLTSWSISEGLVIDFSFNIKQDNEIKPTQNIEELMQNIEELIVVSTVISSDINILNEYISELHNILIDEFDEDVLFEKVSQLNMIRLQNKDVKIDYKFKIINITNNEDLKIVKETLRDIQEQLTTWALNKKSKINFVFKIE